MIIYEAENGFFLSKCGRVFKEAKYGVRGTKKRRYLFVVINQKKKDVHRLMAETFLPAVRDKNWVLHNDDNALNNHIDNLRWGTPKDNAQDATKNGRFSGRGKIRKNSRNEELYERLLAGERASDLAKIYKISQAYVSLLYKKYRTHDPR